MQPQGETASTREKPRDRAAARIGVIVFPGSHDHRDAAWALEALGAEPLLVWHQDRRLPRGIGAVLLPGGFSYGDYLRCGAIARFAPAMDAVVAFIWNGGLVLGICNGFQILCEAGLLPGALLPNLSLTFVCRDVELCLERNDTPFTRRCTPAQRLTMPVKHGHGRWFAGPELLSELSAAGQIALRYADGENPNGSVADVAGVINADGNVMGLMPHPEHAVDPLLGSLDGGLILASLVDAASERALVGA